MWKGSIFSDWNGEQYASICQIIDLVDQVSTDLNTRIYYLISVPQITWLLLGGAIILFKTPT